MGHAALLLLLPLLLARMQCSWASGVFELQILEFSNSRLQLSSGRCCEGGGGGGVGGEVTAGCTAPCRTRFTLCLKEYQASSGGGGGAGGGGGGAACSFGRVASPVLGTDSFTLTEPLYTLALPFTFRWTRSFTLILQAYDDYNYTDPEESGLISEARWGGIVEPGGAWHALRHATPRASLAYRVRVRCQPNYYNTTCTSFCRPRDDKFGHYTCSPQGDKLCVPGWRGDNCDIPVCKEGCHPTHGHCTSPGECECRPGWRGELCAQCQPYPGCKHGYCNGSSWDCTCDTNWGGILCDQDLNYCGTHEPCRHGGTCENTAPDQYLCTCAEGFSGADCERVDNPCAPAPCRHGECSLRASPPGYTCTCDAGWAGPACDRDLDDCASAPCRHGAACRDRVAGYECLCAEGWTGSDCAEDVDECARDPPPCVNAAACTNSPGGYSCACLPGWTGRDCAHNVDDCARGPCLHGATCIDLVDDFHCACAPGWAGRTCTRDVDECASRPCRNGGECVDLLDDYRCICPVGFAGRDCEDDRDHCAEAPCANGAPCYTAQSDYYCHCTPPWTGKNCSVLAAAAAPSAGSVAALPAAPTATATAPAAVANPPCGPDCLLEMSNKCTSNPCLNNGTCIESVGGVGAAQCACGAGWTGARCGARVEDAWCAGACLHGGACVPHEGGWRCACAAGRAGRRCEREAGCAECVHGRCVAGAGWRACECAAGWAGAACDLRVPPAPCVCPPPARCLLAEGDAYRCECPVPPARGARRCLELTAGLDEANEALEETWNSDLEEWDARGECGVGSGTNGSWWWGCNVCWCGGGGGEGAAGGGGGAQCTRLWCGVADCRAGAACRADEVCVPAAPALCLRAPCSAPAECRRVSARRVAPPALPAPAACWPGARAPAPGGCARAVLELARERLARGAHVERACSTLRRALAAALAPRLSPLALLCDLATDDDDMLDLALAAIELTGHLMQVPPPIYICNTKLQWVGEEEGAAGVEMLAAAQRALEELLARRRLAAHPLLGAALRLRTAPAPPPRAAPAAPAASLWAGLAGAAAALLLAAGALYVLRRRRRAAERARTHDEEKSNNLQNEENLRRYAHPTPPTGAPPAAAPAELPRAHSLYKAQNEDARNNTPRAPDKDCGKRALPPPAPPARPAAALAPPERLTVLV